MVVWAGAIHGNGERLNALRDYVRAVGLSRPCLPAPIANHVPTSAAVGAQHVETV